MIFHRHQWRQVRRYHVPPVDGMERLRVSRETFREVTQGFTVVELRCEGCGDLRARKLPGDAA